jgi:Zn-dependent protease
MFPSKYRLCELFGIPVFVDMSFAFLLILFTLNSGSFSFGLATALLLAISITAHELGHALTAALFGFRTRDITLSLLGGCASLISLPRKAWQELLTALAGPLVSFVLAVVTLLCLMVFPIENYFLGSVLQYFMYMNFMLGAFNLLPGFPMDGGRIFRSVMRIFMSRSRATLAAMWVGRAFAVLLGIRGLHSIFTGGSWGFISILIAWMIWREGWREYQQALAEDRWDGPWRQEDFNARVSPPPYGKD